MSTHSISLHRACVTLLTNSAYDVQQVGNDGLWRAGAFKPPTTWELRELHDAPSQGQILDGGAHNPLSWDSTGDLPML